MSIWDGCHLCDTKRVDRWVQSCRNHDSGYMIHGHHIYGVTDSWAAFELNASLPHSNQEIVSVRHTIFHVTSDVAWSYNGPREPTIRTRYSDTHWDCPYPLPKPVALPERSSSSKTPSPPDSMGFTESCT